jgi:rhomboid protease GluP
MIKRARVMQTLLGINVLVFIIVNGFMGIEGMAFFWQDNRRIIYNGEFYRLITSIFLHLDIEHLFANCVGIVVFGTAVEIMYSGKECAIIYIITGFIGNLAGLLINSYSIALGASGAVFGLMGAMALIILVDNKSLMLFTLLYLVVAIIQSFEPGIGTWGHIFGLIAGLAYARWRKPEYYHAFVKIVKKWYQDKKTKRQRRINKTYYQGF